MPKMESGQQSFGNRRERTIAMILLILAGETIFMLPFMIARIFRPTLLTVFEITNLELGLAFSGYGLVAVVSYVIGGPLADRFPTNWLMCIAMVTTGIGGFYMYTIPDVIGLNWLFGAWGITTILLFWAALIKATRVWGGAIFSGRAFGLLDGGRGMYAALIGTIGVALFASTVSGEGRIERTDELVEAFRVVILAATVFTIGIGIIVGFGLKSPQGQKGAGIVWSDVKSILRLPTVWLQSIIIICAYVGYKCSDDFSLYANEVMLFDDVDSAKMSTLSYWIRPIGAISAGFLADRFTSVNMIIISFATMFIGASLFASGLVVDSTLLLFYTTLITTSLGLYALRGLYYAVMYEGHIPVRFTGTAVGIVAVIGYTPEIFMGPLMGYLLDSSPGLPGHRHVFTVLAIFCVIGMIAALLYRRIAGKMALGDEME